MQQCVNLIKIRFDISVSLRSSSIHRETESNGNIKSNFKTRLNRMRLLKHRITQAYSFSKQSGDRPSDGRNAPILPTMYMLLIINAYSLFQTVISGSALV